MEPVNCRTCKFNVAGFCHRAAPLAYHMNYSQPEVDPAMEGCDFHESRGVCPHCGKGL